MHLKVFFSYGLVLTQQISFKYEYITKIYFVQVTNKEKHFVQMKWYLLFLVENLDLDYFTKIYLEYLNKFEIKT